VLMDQVRLLDVDARPGGIADGAHSHRRVAQGLAAFVLGALVGSALMTYHMHPSTFWTHAVAPSSLWESHWQHQGHHGWHHHSDDDKVFCGAGEHCTCSWASASQCSTRDAPETKCWSCCCRARFPESYRRAMIEDQHWRGDDSHYHRGDAVNVQSVHGHWHPASVLDRVSQGRYQVQYDVSRRVEVVRSDQMQEGVWTPWWVWVFWLLLFACIIMCVVGLLGFLFRGKKKRKEDVAEMLPLKEESQDRSCMRTCALA